MLKMTTTHWTVCHPDLGEIQVPVRAETKCRIEAAVATGEALPEIYDLVEADFRAHMKAVRQ
ncbi:hypothetical protein [Asticcacaulis sp.]|uniref:hypothetical protein n=1 Tax=Asticcacaulis sp. TaxID=1872648 RepID=UPI00391A0F8D